MIPGFSLVTIKQQVFSLACSVSFLKMSETHLRTGQMCCMHQLHLFLHAHTPGNSLLSVLMPAHILKHIPQRNQGALSSWVGLSSMRQCADKSWPVFGFTLLDLLKHMDMSSVPPRCLSFNAKMFHIKCFAMIHFANQIQTGRANRFGYLA